MEAIGWREFRNALKIQIRVQKALIRREFIAMNGRQGLGFLMLFAEPLVIMGFLMALGVFRNVPHLGTGFPVYSFVISGWGVMWLCRYPMQRVGAAIAANLSFLAHRQITVLDLVFSRCLLMVVAVLASLSLIYLIYFTFFIDSRFNDPGIIVLGLLLALWYSFVSSVLGVAVSSYTILGGKFIILFAAAHIFITGALFMVDWLPLRYQGLLLLFPMVHATEMIRDGMFGNLVKCHYDIKYTCFFLLVYTYVSFRFLVVKSQRGKLNGMPG